MGVVHHEPFDHVLSKIDCLLMSRRDNHPILGIDHTAHLNAFGRTFQEHHRTHAAGTHRSQTGMVAETGDDDPQPRRSLNDFHPFWDFDLQVIDL
jgi:hypothetical protein